MGNLTRDPEVRQAQSGTFVVNAGIAVNERMPDGQGGWKEEASFFDLVIFGKRGEAFARFLKKGRPVLVEGTLRQGRWQDKETGQNRSKIEIIVDNWEFVGGGREEGGGNAGGGGGQYGNSGGRQQQEAGGTSPGFPERSDFGGQGGGGGGGGFPDDVPF